MDFWVGKRTEHLTSYGAENLTYTLIYLKSITRSGKKLEGGDEKVTGDTMTLARVTPQEAGVYICTASNQHSR